MNKELIRKMVNRMSSDEMDELGGILTTLTLEAIKDTEDSIEDGREREVYELGKQIGTLEFIMNEYNKYD